MDAEYALVGGGLQNGLIALALEAARPAARIVMIERSDRPGGNHTWCFHAGDLAAMSRIHHATRSIGDPDESGKWGPSPLTEIPDWIERLIVARWDGYDVAFPAYSRTLASPYACVSSERFAHEVTRSLTRTGCRLITRATAIEVDAYRVLVRHADGSLEEIRAHAVIDARGPEASALRPNVRGHRGDSAEEPSAHVGALDSAELAGSRIARDVADVPSAHVGARDSRITRDTADAPSANVGALDPAELAASRTDRDVADVPSAHVGALDSRITRDTADAPSASVVALDAAEPAASRTARDVADVPSAHDAAVLATSGTRARDRAAARSGWQKFLGQELRLAAPHHLARPMLMDATVAQIDASAPVRDGFRFLYVLPLAEDRVLVEDTYFSDGTHIDASELRARIAAYVARREWRVVECVREEAGLLPLPLRADSPSPSLPLRAGYAGGWFHPVTGYSFPIAARLAALVASVPPEQLVGSELRAMARAQAKQMAFALRLNRMLFGWFAPAQRFRVLERFYRLDEALIRRFYALELGARDKARILVGRPPRGMSIRAAFGGQLVTQEAP